MIDRTACLVLVFAVLSLPARVAAAPRVCDSSEGAVIDAVELIGLASAPGDEVKAALGVQPGAVVSPLSLTKLESAVLETGWFASASVVISPSASGGCVLRVRLREYPLVEEVHFPGVVAYGGGKTLGEGLETQPGRTSNLKTAQRDAEKIAARYHASGYEAARVTGIEIGEGIVTFKISEGRIARVEVAGARRTGARRVRKVLNLKKGDLYNTSALAAGQGALYRTSLFSSVGFGVEPLGGPEGSEDELVLTVTVAELKAPYSRTEVFADRGDAGTTIEARLRNVGRGNSARVLLEIAGASPRELADTGFDEFYRGRAAVEMRLFRPDPAAAGGRIALDTERVRSRVREDLGLSFDVDLPSARAALEVPALTRADLSGSGTFAAIAGWRLLSESELPETPGSPPVRTSDPWGRGEVGFELTRISGLEEPAAMRARAGVELNRGERPYSYLAFEGRYDLVVARGVRLEARGDFGSLAGRRIPYWREFALGGPAGPVGFGRELAFTRTYGRGRVAWAGNLPRNLFGAAAGWEGAAWDRVDGSGVRDAQSLFVELRAGPEFARLRGGLAAPLPGASARELWWFAGIVVATPY